MHADQVGLTLFLSTLPARGATMVYGWETRHTVVFLSTLPARGATVVVMQ